MTEELVRIVRENNRIPDEVVIDRSSRLDTDIGLSSYDLMEVLTTIEDTYNVEIPKDQIADFDTLGDLEDCLKKLIGEKSGC